jgi:hypothetical protein
MRQDSNLVHGRPYRREINAGYRIRIESASAGSAGPAHWIPAPRCAVTGQYQRRSPGSGVSVSNRGSAASRLWQRALKQP